MKHQYHIEVFCGGEWLRIITRSREWCEGYLDAKEDVSIGQTAGWPTAEQYEAAAKRAVDIATAIRERESN